MHESVYERGDLKHQKNIVYVLIRHLCWPSLCNIQICSANAVGLTLNSYVLQIKLLCSAID